MNAWRRRLGTPEEPRPSLAAVLDHYGVAHTPGRVAQMTRCPLHEDRHPSLSLHMGREVWRCHSCGKGGDAYALIMEKEGIDFVRARAVAATLGPATGGHGGGDEQLRGSRYTRRRQVPARPGDQPAARGYVPRWRRG